MSTTETSKPCMDGIEKFCQLWILDLVDSKCAAYFTNDLSKTPVLESAKNDMLDDEMEAQKCAGGLAGVRQRIGEDMVHFFLCGFQR